tara:strand:- start:16064 stop:16774 length:711 start_codon:yes stop_codon:yes gene_type:complete
MKNINDIKLLTEPIGSTKTKKSLKYKYANYILYLLPSNQIIDNKKFNTCPWSSKGCSEACLNTSGRGRFDSVQNARYKKTLYFFKDKDNFINQLKIEINKAIIKSEKKGLIPVFRLNGTSDLPFHKFNIFEEFPNIQFYDYTKDYKKVLNNNIPNYHLTFSLSESNEEKALQVKQNKHNVAIVFNTLPKYYKFGNKYYRVIDGDKHDLRFLDYRNVIVGLLAKGDAKKDNSGFVRN